MGERLHQRRRVLRDISPEEEALAAWLERGLDLLEEVEVDRREAVFLDAVLRAAHAQFERFVGAEVDEFADGLTITPRPLHGAEIETYNDHRMAMSMALIGLRVPGIVIKNPGCVAKTYPAFWDDLEKLRQ